MCGPAGFDSAADFESEARLASEVYLRLGDLLVTQLALARVGVL